MTARPACVICSAACPPSRRTYCSATCAAVYYGPKGTRTLRDQVARDLFFARESFARSDAPSHEMRVRIDYLTVWLAELDRTGAGRALAFSAPSTRPVHPSAQLALALSEVA